jgi:hypothetical protein
MAVDLREVIEWRWPMTAVGRKTDMAGLADDVRS